MKKEYLIGGLLGIVLCGIVAYAIMAFIDMQGHESARQLAEQMPPPVPLEDPAPETQQPAKDLLSVQEKPESSMQASGLPDSRKADEPKAAVEAQPAAGTAAETDKKDESGKTAAGTPAQPEDGNIIKGLTPDQIKRLDEINERKAVLKPERERLIREREQLHEDVRNSGVVRFQEQIDAIARRITDLEARINGFNEEVKKLNEEEKRLIEDVNPAKP